METEQYLDRLTSDSELLADAADAAGPDADVPTCPGWKISDLMVHMVQGDLWARRIVESRSTERTLPEMPADAPEGAALVPYFRAGARQLAETLATVPSDTSVWTFSADDRTARFWQRRRAQETAVHRVDAQSAIGAVGPIDTALAADGIDEFLFTFLPRLAGGLADLGDATLHLHCTDTEGEWLITRAGDDVVVTRQHAKGDVAARGSASDLLLFLWGRVPTSALEVFGDGALIERFQDAVRV
jgi:uncharacterized protein (TIGR03083 family)